MSMLYFLIAAVQLLTNVYSARGHECARPCIAGEAPKVCHYNFTLEWYLTMSKACFNCPFNVTDCYRPDCVAADGKRRAFIAINRQLPGPPIEVCEDDTVVVLVKNDLVDGQGVTMHWHGIHQRNTQYMDGTNLITQCPINMMSEFRYEFQASPGGTHFYHSHVGFQRGDGVYGSFIVHTPPESEPNYALYDHDCATPSGDCEHHVILADWFNEPGTARYAYLMHHVFDLALPQSSLINGRNKKYRVESADKTKSGFTPYEIFGVNQGKRYRFRVIAATNMICPYKVSVDGHNLTIIAADGHSVKPLHVEVFTIYPGERYDFVLEANQTIGNYWFRALGMVDCAMSKNKGHAILRYAGAKEMEPTESLEIDRRGRYFNPVLSDDPWSALHHGAPLDILADELEDAQNRSIADQKVDVSYYIALDFLRNDNSRFNKHPYSFDSVHPMQATFTPVINNITFKMPSVPLLSQPEDIDLTQVCNSSTVNMEKCEGDLCVCTHIMHFKMDQVVELVLVNEGTAFDGGGHPMHLHGYSFRVIATGKLGKTTSVKKVKELYQAGQIPVRLASPSLRDTINVPDGGYTIIRFIAHNPGYWFFHCHVESHTEQGQAMVMHVGEKSHLPPVPANFPRCGSWLYKERYDVTVPPENPNLCVSDSSTSLRFSYLILLLCVSTFSRSTLSDLFS